MEEEASLQKESPINTLNSISQGKVMFMEEVDYRMEVHDADDSSKKVLLKNEQFSEEEKR